MNSTLTLALLIILLAGCTDNRQNNSINTSNQTNTKIDTNIGCLDIKLIPGQDYKKAKSYFAIVGNDTSHFNCIFKESKYGQSVQIVLPNNRQKLSYSQKLSEIRKILPQAAKEFNLDSLKLIWLGRLVNYGNLAIEVTKEYKKKFGYGNTIKDQDYKPIAHFLKESKLGKDLNNLFNEYSIVVDSVFPEQIFFTSRNELFLENKIETDTTGIPENILDCSIIVDLKKR